MTWIVWLFSSIINHNALLSSISLSHSPSSNHSSTIHQFNHNNNNNNNNNNPFIHCFNHFIILLFISTSTQSLQLLLHFNPSSLSHTQKMSIPQQQQSIIFDTSISTSNPISLLFNILSCFNSLFINNHSNPSTTIHSIMVSCAFCLQSIQSHSPLQNLITCVFNFTSNPIPSTHNTTHTCLFTSIHSSLHLPHTHVPCNVAVHVTFISFLVFHNQCPTAFPFVHPNIHITLPLSTSFILLSVSPSFNLCNDFCFSPALVLILMCQLFNHLDPSSECSHLLACCSVTFFNRISVCWSCRFSSHSPTRMASTW